MWTFWIVDTLTGDKLARFAPTAGRFRTVMNGVGDGEHSILLRSSDWPYSRAQNRDLTTPWARTLVQCWNDVPKYSGLITKRAWNEASGVLRIESEELRTIFTRRLAFTIGLYDGGTLTVTGKSLRGLIRAIVMAAAYRPPVGDPWHLPIAYPADEGGSESRTWYNYNFPVADEMLDEVQNINGGPDIYFKPRWSGSDKHEWELQIGTPSIAGPTLDWHVKAAEAPALDVGVVEDGTKQLTGVFSIGKGSEADMRHGEAGHLAGTTIPYLDTTRSYKEVDDVARLNAHAMGELVAYREVTTQYSFDTLASGTPSLDQLSPGARPRLWFDESEFVDDGWKNLYLLGMSGDLTEKISLEVQGV